MSNPRKKGRLSALESDVATLPTSNKHLTSYGSSFFNGESTYIDNGDCPCVCEHCGALFWFDERIVSMSSNRQFRYNQCCKGGCVRIPNTNTPRLSIRQLFEEPKFLANIRAYNYMFSMTSFGGKVDESINSGAAPYVFKVEGQVYHWLGSLCPLPNERPRFLQLYIYDTENEIQNRLQFFNDSTRSRLNDDTVTRLLQILDESNELVRLFRDARDLCRSSNIPSFFVRLYNSHNSLCYDHPGPGCIGAIVTDIEPNTDGFDIVIRHKDTGPQRINNLHPLYMSLQYPLLFVHGESGWSRDLRLHGSYGRRDRNMTMNMFYSYQIHDRLNVYTLLLRGGRLFQQYLVDAYICIEQNRLEYIRKNQNILRTEFLQGIHDAVERGDTEGREIGKHTILPSSFTGGPRYMYKHYQDALAICRVHGNPQYFITFTCNVKWPEIQRYLAQYPALKPQDRPDIIARVFHIKVVSLINFLKTKMPFGRVVAGFFSLACPLCHQHNYSVITTLITCLDADLYTIEFQKRGLPHCHLLLWVAESHRIKDAGQIDRYISAEIPDPVIQPQLHTIVTELMMHGPCGVVRPNASCMSNGTCSKHFPKDYELTTHFDKNGYAHYRRSSSGIQRLRVALD